MKPVSRNRGVSELYASLLMVGVTLALGGVVTAAAVSAFNGSSGSAVAAIAAQETSAAQQVSLLYATVNGLASTTCTKTWGAGAYKTQSTYTLALYNYGSGSFTPNEIFDNSSLISSWSGTPSNALSAGGTTVYTLATSCARPSGQTFLLVDSNGDEVQVGT